MFTYVHLGFYLNKMLYTLSGMSFPSAINKVTNGKVGPFFHNN